LSHGRLAYNGLVRVVFTATNVLMGIVTRSAQSTTSMDLARVKTMEAVKRNAQSLWSNRSLYSSIGDHATAHNAPMASQFKPLSWDSFPLTPPHVGEGTDEVSFTADGRR
jgi:hypothetical protein